MKDLTYPLEVRRVVLHLEEGRWEVVSDVRGDAMTLPTPLTVPESSASGPLGGSYWEAVDAEGEVIYRDYADDPGLGMELFDLDGTVRRTVHAGHDSSMELLIPAVPELAGVRLVMARPATSDAGDDREPEVTVLSLGDPSDTPDDPQHGGHEDGEGDGDDHGHK